MPTRLANIFNYTYAIGLHTAVGLIFFSYLSIWQHHLEGKKQIRDYYRRTSLAELVAVEHRKLPTLQSKRNKSISWIELMLLL